MNKKVLLLAALLLFFVLSPLCFATNIEISAPSAILADFESGKILYEKNSNEKMYPASLTKMLTAIITLEKGKLYDVVEISEEAVNSVPESYAGLTIEIGEKLTVEELLNVLLITSSNIAGNALGEYISGTTEEFAKVMNNKAKEIGCTNSNFVNPYGLHDDNHYSTAYDMYLIASYCMKNDTFRSIVSKKNYVIPATNKNEVRVVNNSNELLYARPGRTSHLYKDTIGIKTGFTTPAKECLAAGAKKDNFEIISVVLGCNTNDLKYVDTTKLFDFAYENYEYKKIFDAETSSTTVTIENAKDGEMSLKLYPEKDISALSKKSFEPVSEINLNKNIKAPIKNGDILRNS